MTTRTQVSRIDSLNGIPGHHFGDPLSAFPGIELAKSQQPGTHTYTYPTGKPEGGWFGKHKNGDLFVFYTFKDDKFAGFQAVAFGTTRAALEEEAIFLLGPGKRILLTTSWTGEQAVAAYSSQTLARGAAGILEIQTLSLANALEREATARLKRENSGQ